jgi:glycosyltransferase-like protein LARGE
VAVHIEDNDQKLQAIEALHETQRTVPLFAKYVDVHLIIDRFDRQFNLWRNVARLFSRTNLIMTLDVDFMLCTDLRANFDQLAPEHRERVLNGSAVFVIPAFEYAKKAAEIDATNYPDTKIELLPSVQSHEIIMFHAKWQRGHGPTDYKRWSMAVEPYLIDEYNYNYEPYVLMHRDGHPWYVSVDCSFDARCDERFVGYGSNKAACLYEIFLSGAEFWAMPNDFLIHQRHPYPENDRRVEVRFVSMHSSDV